MSEQTLRVKDSGRPLYMSLEKHIFKQIKNGELKPGDRLDSASVLGKKWNVSPATVVHSLQRLAAKGVVVRKPRSGTYVNPEYIEPNGNAVSASKTISFVCWDNRFPESAPTLNGIQDIAHENGLDVIVANTNGSLDRFNEVLSRQIDANPFGIFLSPPITGGVDTELLHKLKKSNVPVVTRPGPIEGTDWPCVTGSTSDDLCLSVKHLVEQGRKKIAFMSYFSDSSNERDIYNILHYAFAGALNKSGGSFDYELQLGIPVPCSFDEILEKRVQWSNTIKEWLIEHENVDAICCTYDRIAWEVIGALQQLGRKIPQEVAVTGIGHLAMYYGFDPEELTSVDINGYQMGVEVCKLLVAMRNGEKITPNLKIKIDGKLVVGRSTKKLCAIP